MLRFEGALFWSPWDCELLSEPRLALWLLLLWLPEVGRWVETAELLEIAERDSCDLERLRMRLGSSGLGELLGVVWELWRSDSTAVGGRERGGGGMSLQMYMYYTTKMCCCLGMPTHVTTVTNTSPAFSYKIRMHM